MNAYSRSVPSQCQSASRLLVLLAVLLGGQSQSLGSDESVSIGSITVSPQANHRRTVVLRGAAKDIKTLTGSDVYGFATCGQTFTLEDSTGSIDVLYIIKCQSGGNILSVNEGDQTTVYAIIHAPPTTSLKTSNDVDTSIKALATKLVKSAP